MDNNLAELKIKLENESVINFALNDLKKNFEQYFNVLEKYVKASTGYHILISDEKFPFSGIANISGVKINRQIYYFTHIYIDIPLDERNIFGFRKKLNIVYHYDTKSWSACRRHEAKLQDIDRVINSVVKSIEDLQLKIRGVRNNG